MLSEGKRAGETTRLHSGCRTLWAPLATSSLLLGRPLPAPFAWPISEPHAKNLWDQARQGF
ncbi:MAG: hypothetical protein Q8P67_23290 [archaeon]|nr:hypothetical protein [archaeon]